MPGKGKLSSSESDQSSTETDSTIKSQDLAPVEPLDPHELAQKILQETQSHMWAVESLQKENRRGQTLPGPKGPAEESAGRLSMSTPSTPTLTSVGGGLGFRRSETSAFSRPSSRASLKTCPSPLPPHRSPLPAAATTPPLTWPKPHCRSSSLQKISSGFNSPNPSSPSLSSKGRTALPPSSQLRTYSSGPELKHRATHISPSLSISPNFGNLSPSDSVPSPAFSYSSTGSTSTSSSPANNREFKNVLQADDSVQEIHNLKTLWTNASQKREVPRPPSILRGGSKKMSTVQKDVLGLLNLSPRRDLVSEHRDGSQDRSPIGHRKVETKPTSQQSPILTTNSKGSCPAVNPQPIRLPSGNGYKVFTPGQFFPSSKC